MFSRAMLACAVAVCALSASVSAKEFAHKNVVILTEANFQEKVNDGGLWFVKFYAPWCGHCKRLGPDWAKLADGFTSDAKINIAQVDCTTDRGVCTKFEIKGYPTLKMINGGEEVKAYKGSRDLESLQKYTKETATDYLTEST